MATRDQTVLLDFARAVFDEQDFNSFVRLLHLREHPDPRVRAQANVELSPMIATLKAYLDVQQKPQLHAV